FWETLAGRSRLEHVQAGDEARYQGYRGYAACGALDLSLLLCCLRRILSRLSHSSERPPHLAPLRHRRIFIAWKPWGPQDDKMGSLACLGLFFPQIIVPIYAINFVLPYASVTKQPIYVVFIASLAVLTFFASVTFLLILDKRRTFK